MCACGTTSPTNPIRQPRQRGVRHLADRPQRMVRPNPPLQINIGEQLSRPRVRSPHSHLAPLPGASEPCHRHQRQRLLQQPARVASRAAAPARQGPSRNPVALPTRLQTAVEFETAADPPGSRSAHIWCPTVLEKTRLLRERVERRRALSNIVRASAIKATVDPRRSDFCLRRVVRPHARRTTSLSGRHHPRPESGKRLSYDFPDAAAS